MFLKLAQDKQAQTCRRSGETSLQQPGSSRNGDGVHRRPQNQDSRKRGRTTISRNCDRVIVTSPSDTTIYGRVIDRDMDTSGKSSDSMINADKFGHMSFSDDSDSFELVSGRDDRELE